MTNLEPARVVSGHAVDQWRERICGGASRGVVSDAEISRRMLALVDDAHPPMRWEWEAIRGEHPVDDNTVLNGRVLGSLVFVVVEGTIVTAWRCHALNGGANRGKYANRVG